MIALFQQDNDRDKLTRTNQVTFLEGCSTEDWQTILRFAEQQDFRDGEVLVAYGEPGDALYILSSGRAEVILHPNEPEQHVVAVLPAGSVFGEMAFFDGEPRSATIRAIEGGRAIRLARNGFDQLAAWEPVLARRILMDLGRVLALRLRWAQRREAP